MADHRTWRLPTGPTVHAVFSDRSDGDLARDVTASELARRRAALAPIPWTWLHQVHGATVLEVARAGQYAGAEADGSVTAEPDVALSVQVADCAPVLLFSPTDTGAVVGAAHAGWQGIEAGIIGSTVEAMMRLGAREISWTLGPCISPDAYEFSADDLDRLAGTLGPSVRSRTTDGAAALDLRAAVSASLAAAGIVSPPLGPPPACTAESGRHWSHRARAESARQVGVVWWERSVAESRSRPSGLPPAPPDDTHG